MTINSGKIHYAEGWMISHQLMPAWATSKASYERQGLDHDGQMNRTGMRIHVFIL